VIELIRVIKHTSKVNDMAGKKNKQNRNKKMFKIIKSINFKGNGDAEVLELINEYAHLRRGLAPKAALRNLLFRILPAEIERLRQNSQDSRYLETA